MNFEMVYCEVVNLCMPGNMLCPWNMSEQLSFPGICLTSINPDAISSLTAFSRICR